EWQGSRSAAEKSNELAPFHCCLHFRCVTGFSWFLGAGQRDGRSSARLRDAPPAPCGKNYTLGRCSERRGHDEYAPVRIAFVASAATFACVFDVSAATHATWPLDPLKTCSSV